MNFLKAFSNSLAATTPVLLHVRGNRVYIQSLAGMLEGFFFFFFLNERTLLVVKY